MLRFAVVGNPVAHSKSPQIHSQFAKQTGLALDYSKIKVEPDNFEAFVAQFFSEGGSGLNVTLPFKESAFQMVDVCTSRARLAAAVNTLYLDSQGRLNGDNTDGRGLLIDIQENHGIAMQDKNILVLGAGGAVRGVLTGFIEAKPNQVLILNRTESRAIKLQQEFADYLPISSGQFSDAPTVNYDLIINGTSSGLQNEVPPITQDYITEKSFCYDMMYGSADTPFVSWAKAAGAKKAVDGLGMLVEQAAESFSIWCKIRPDTSAVISQLRSEKSV